MSRSKALASPSPIFKIQDADRFFLDDSFIEEFKSKEPKWGPVGKVAYVRTYARELRHEELVQFLMRDMKMDRKAAKIEARKVKSKREEFWQTARRVVEFTWTVFKRQAALNNHAWDAEEAQHKAQEMFQRLWNFKWLPSGRGMQFAGTPVVEIKGGAVLNSCGFVSTENLQTEFAEPFCRFMDFLMLGVGMGSDVRGACPNGAPNRKLRVQKPAELVSTFVVEDTREGWVDTLRAQLNGYFKGENRCTFDFSKVRKEGVPLKTLGGTSSGYAPLARLLSAVERTLEPLIGSEITATAIADIFNEIGVCVVSGNIRRSAEILIGYEADEEFASLKDPSQLRVWAGKISELENSIPEVVRIRKRIGRLRELQASLSAADPKFLEVQDKIDRAGKRIAAEIRKSSVCPEISELQDKIDQHPLNTRRWASNNSQLFQPISDFSKVENRIVSNGEPGVAFLDNIRAYGRMTGQTEPPLGNWADRDAVGFNPCAEQSLEDGELCCLGELNPNAHANWFDFRQTIKYAYMYCKAVTLVPTHDPATNKIITKNRRIGLSMMGIWKMYERLGMQECVRWWWDLGYREVRGWDKTYSQWLGVNESVKVTSVKPGGTIPLLVGEEGGMKVPTAKYYFRTMRMDHTSPLVKSHQDAGYRVEKDRASPRTVVVYFPVHDPQVKRTADQVTMWEQMCLLGELQAHWSDNMVSNTITFKPEEAPQIAQAIGMFAHRIKSVSFLPLMTHGYAQAPYIPITEQEYEAAVAKLKPLDLSSGGHEVDEKYCTGELCMKPA